MMSPLLASVDASATARPAKGSSCVWSGGPEGVDPDVHNSNPGEFRGPRLRVQVHDPSFPEDEALEALRHFIAQHGTAPTARSWQAAGMTPSEQTIRRRFGSFKAAVIAALREPTAFLNSAQSR